MRGSGHPYHATAVGDADQPPARWLAALAAGLLIAGCGDPVGDARNSFEVDPGPVLGRWVERDPTDSPPREAIIGAGRGVLEGSFEFERTGLPFTIEFAEGAWDGTSITFTTGDVFGAGVESIAWTARLTSATEGEPAVLRLFPRVDRSVPFSLEYVRP